MLANWVKQATSTTGTGTITLGSAETGFIAFGDAFSDGDVVHYSIEDGNNREIGIGTYIASGPSLSRDTVLETLASGTFDNTSPTAISLSGSAIVSVVGSSFSQFKAGSGEADSSGVVSSHNYYRSEASMPLTANTLYAVPFRLDQPLTCGAIEFYLAVAQAASNLRVGIAGIDNANLPHQLVVEGSVVDSSTTGQKSSTFTQVILTPGWYYILFCTDTTGVEVKANNLLQTVHNPLGITGTLNEPRTHAYGTHTYGALPADVGAVTTTLTRAHYAVSRLSEG